MTDVGHLTYGATSRIIRGGVHPQVTSIRTEAQMYAEGALAAGGMLLVLVALWLAAVAR